MPDSLAVSEVPPCVQRHANSYLLVFLFGPWPFDKVWIQNPQPPVLALLVRAVLGREQGEQEPVKTSGIRKLDSG